MSGRRTLMLPGRHGVFQSLADESPIWEPRALALFLTASSKGSGSRIFTRASFFSNSNRTDFAPERSYSVRPAAGLDRRCLKEWYAREDSNL